jgi:hypothetical protein
MTQKIRVSYFASTLLLLLAATVPAAADASVPFKGTFEGHTVSAVPTADPDVLFITTVGGGVATQLGLYTMVSPHHANLVTGEATGQQNFTAANGDLLTADFSGQFLPIGPGVLAAQLRATITGGTGRFSGVTGSYTFSIVFDFASFTSRATIDGTLSIPGTP